MGEIFLWIFYNGDPFDHYAYFMWYPNLTKKLKDILRVTQNKCADFHMILHSRKRISNAHFQKLNWFPMSPTFE